MVKYRRLLACAAVCVLLAADWPQFLGPKRDGHSAETGLATSWPKDGPPIVWQREVGAGYAGPVIAGGKLILFHRVGAKEVVECLAADTGKPLWTQSYGCTYSDGFGKGDGPRATPVINDKRIYTLGAAGHLLCVALADGKKIWAHDLLDEYKVPASYFGIGTTPLVEGDLVLVNVGGVDAGIVAFNKETGKEVWKATSQAASYAAPIAATIEGVHLALFFTRQGLVGLEPATGAVKFEKRWRSRMDASVNAASPIAVGDQIFLTACYNTGAVLLKVSRNKLDEVWKSDDVLSCHFTTPVYVDGFLYGSDGRQEAEPTLRCVDWSTGKVRWTRDGFGCGWVLSAPGMLILLSEKGDLVLAEATPKAYTEKAKVSLLGRPCRAAPALAEGRFYARDDRKLICVDLSAK